MKILVADDDAVLRNELAGLLREDGHDVVGASDGGEALCLVERESFDAALLDLRMPKASGLQVLHRLRVARPETAVVVITGQGTIDAAVEAMKAGAVDFVEKPYEVEALRRTLLTVREEQRARTLLGVPAAEGAIARALSDATTRKVLLAVVGPRAQPPANPIRRAVVAYVVASGPVAYSGILKKNFVDSSSKLSFHLQKLQSDGLLAKGDAGRYVVTEAGQRAWQVVRALSDRKPPSLLISKS